MYLNLVQLAESFGVSERIVEGWIREEGLPHTPEGRVLLFDRAQVAQWAATRGPVPSALPNRMVRSASAPRPYARLALVLL